MEALLEPKDYLLYCKVCGLSFSVFKGETDEKAFDDHLRSSCDNASIIIKQIEFCRKYNKEDLILILRQIFSKFYKE